MPIKPLLSKERLINNRYELIEKLGQGGMGAVYKAFDRVNQEYVALKQVRLSTSLTSTETDSERANTNRVALTSEFQQLASLHHPNIVQVLDYGWDENGASYFTMTFLDNTKNVVEASKDATNEQRLDYFIQLMQALMYIHRRGIVHRDLKPENIMIFSDNKLQLVDFGIASEEHLPQEGLLGTILYMPPEVVQSSSGTVEILRTSDLYSAGLIAYEMFTGLYPFDRKTVKSLLRDIMKNYPDLSILPKLRSDNKRLNTRLPLETIIGRLLSKDVKFRYQDAMDVLDDLTQVVGEDAVRQSTEVRESYLKAATFIGRKTERKVLLSQLKQLRDTHVGSSVLIGGESGVGKSRLMDEIRVQALVNGITVLRAQPSNNVGLRFQMWRDVIRRLVVSTEISDKHAGFLQEVVPDIAELVGHEIPDPPKLMGDAARKNLTNAILSLFAKQKKPMLLLLEDLHWANEGLQVLQELNQLVGKLPLMILGSFRDDEKPNLPDSLPLMRHVKLNRLSKSEIAELSASMLGTSGRKTDIVNLLQRETEGNVLFVIEVLRALVDESGNLENIGAITLPQDVFAGGIQAVLQRRLELVTPEAYTVLKRAAVYGRLIEVPVMELICEQHQLSLDIWLHDCANASVLEIIGGEWQFSHERLREHIYKQLTNVELSDISRELALAVEDLHGNDQDWYEILASLWHDAGDFEKEMNYMRVAIRQLALKSGDYKRVREYAEYALSKLDKDDVRCVDFLNPLSQISGHGGHYQEGYDYARRANELAKQHQYSVGLAQSYNNLGNTAYFLGHHQTAIIYYRHAADIHKTLGNKFELALNLHNLGWTYPHVNDFDSAWDVTEQGQAIFIEMNNMWGIAGGYYIMGLIASQEGDYDEAIDFHHKSLDIYDEDHEDLWGIALNLNNLGFIYLKMGNIALAQDAFYQCLKLTHDTHLHGSLLEALAGVAHVYAFDGRVKQSGLLYGVIESHPAINSDVEGHLQKLMEKLEADFAQDDIWRAIAKGRKRTLDDVVPKLLE